jgi:hypothetical protein
MKLQLEKELHSFASLLEKQKAQNYEKWRNSKENSKTHMLFELAIPGRTRADLSLLGKAILRAALCPV